MRFFQVGGGNGGREGCYEERDSSAIYICQTLRLGYTEGSLEVSGLVKKWSLTRRNKSVDDGQLNIHLFLFVVDMACNTLFV